MTHLNANAGGTADGHIMPAEKPSPRRHDMDRLRASLVILVVLHHIALIYGAAAPFYYQEPPFGDPAAFMLLATFVLLNQSWFMGALFLLAGYFAPESFDRRGPASFLRARLLRLGVPVLAGLFVLEPIARTGFFLMPESLTGITEPPTWSAYPKLIGLGPLWFVAMLLIFDCGYAGWRASVARRAMPTVREKPFPGVLAILAFVLALAALSVFVRMAVPLGKEVSLFVPALNFPTIAYLPQYLSFFVLGIVANRFNWLERMPAAAGIWGVLAALAAGIVLLPAALSGEFLSLTFAEGDRFTGGGNWQSAIYALWDSMTAVGLLLGAVALYRRVFNRGGAVGAFLSKQSYAVYIIHAPILVYGTYAMHDIALPALTKFALAAIILVPVCFACAFVLRRLPLASKVL